MGQGWGSGIKVLGFWDDIIKDYFSISEGEMVEGRVVGVRWYQRYQKDRGRASMT